MMSPNLDELLCSRYPALFSRRRGSPSVTAMARGFTCDDGWFPLIDELCAKLQAAVDSGRIRQPVAQQVKEKFGTLRFYLSDLTPETRAFIDEAEKRSAVTCEVCGTPGILRRQRGVQTVYDLHAEPGSSIVPSRLGRL